MADYYVDESGNITTKKKKKKKQADYYVDESGSITTGTDDIAPVVEDSSSLRDATWGDVFGNSFSRGYQNSVYGTETFKRLTGQSNEADAAKAILEQDKYQFEADGILKKAISGAMEQLGQQWYNLSDPETQTLMVGGGATGAGMAALAGTASPLALVPEEIATVPAGFLFGVGSGYATASAKNALEIEAGLAYNEMIEMGISEDTAKAVALGVGGVNAALELFQVDELVKAFKIVNKSGASDSILKVIKNELIERGVDVVKETAQEVAQEGVTIAGVQAASKHDKGEWAYGSAEIGSRLGETAISSALTFGAMNVPAAVTNITTGTNRVSKTAADEKKVVNKVVEDEIAKREANGTKLSEKEKNKIYDSVVERLEKGQIDVDTIDSMFGGESYSAYRNEIKGLLDSSTYKEYKQALKEDETLAKEIEELGKKEGATPADNFRYTELMQKQQESSTKQAERKAQIEESIKKISEMRTNLRSEIVKKLGANSKLVESYREEARSHQKFKADPTKYKDENARKTIRSIMDSKLANDTREFHEVADWLAAMSEQKGVVFNLTDKKALKGTRYEHKGKTTNAYFNEETGDVVLNIDSERPLNSSVGHELGHVLKGIDANLYEEFKANFKEWANNKNGEWDARYKATQETYAKRDDDGNIIYDDDGNIVYINNSVNIDDEVLNDLIGDYIFTDKDFIKHLSVKQPNAFKHFWDEIKYMVKVAKAGTKVEKELLALEKQFAEIWRETGKFKPKTAETVKTTETADVGLDKFGFDESGVAQYSVSEIVDENNKSYGMGVKLDSTLLEDLTPDERVEMVKERVKELGGKPFTAYDGNGNAVEVIIAEAKEKFKNKNGRKVYVNQDLVGYNRNPVKQEAVVLVDELITTASFKGTESASHPHGWVDNNGKNDWDVWETYIQDKENTVWKAKLRIANSTNGEKILYDVFPIEKVGGVETLDTTPTDDSIAPLPENVNTQFSVSDADAKSGIEYDKSSDSYSPVKYSLSSWDNSDYVTDRKKAATDMAKNLGVTEEQAAKYIDDVNSIAKMIADDKERLSYEPSPNRSAFVSNAEYGGSIDFSTICKKRRLFTGTFEAIQNALPNTALTADEVLEIRKMMKDKGYEVSCGLCYVEGSRTNMGLFTKQFIERYRATNPEYVPNMAEMNTATGQEKIRKEHPEVYEAYEKFMNNYGRLSPTDKALFASQQKPKMYQMSTDYKGEILDKFGGKNRSVEEKNKNGGLRLQSFSDFEIIHLIDSMQVIMDMSRVGLAGQAYTKVPDFAWALGDTGLKINLSLIAKDVDANGRLVLDEVEGMKESDAMALRDRYSDNVGTIIVVFTDSQLKAAMADERIDYIIPYHRSQWKTSQYESMGLPANTQDYTPYQNESYIEDVYNKNGKKQRPSNYMPNNYWDFTKSGKENAEAYLKMCAENNRKPKFSHLLVDNGDGSYSLQPDGSTDGYWKTLIDFKMYNNDGVGVPQDPVVPNFNMEEAQRMLNEYTGGHAKFPVAQDIVDEFVSKHPDNIAPTSDVQYSISDADYMSAVERGDMETAQRMVIEAAEKAGYTSDASWRMQHTAPNSKDDVSLFNLKESGLVPDDYWDHPEWYTYSSEEREAFFKIKRALERSERAQAAGRDGGVFMEIYRAVDKTKNAKESHVRNGDWVTPSYEYAVNEGGMNPNGYRIIKHMANIKNLYWDGNSIAELGYDDGNNFAYADTKNNRKLLDPVTYDDDGNVIPLSKRFKRRNEDERYSLSNVGEEYAPVGDFAVYGKDIAYTPLGEDIAPVAENVAPTTETPKPNVVRPMTEEEANAIQDEKVNAHSATMLEAIQMELENDKELRSEAYASFERKIAQKQAELKAKKNTDTKTANNLRMQIERLKRLRDSTDADYAKRISTLETREKLVREGKPTTRQELHNNIINDLKATFSSSGYELDDVLDKAKDLSTFSTVDNTPQRVMEKALGYKEGQILADLTVNKVAQNETEGIKWLNSYLGKKEGEVVKISKQYGIKPGSDESAAAQMYAEGFYVTENNDIVEYGEAELAQDFPNANTRERIKALARDPRIRQIYDETLDLINESRKRNAYPEIQRLDNYYLHMRAMNDTWSKIGLPFNPNDIRAKDLPTDLNGVTADLKPGQPYFSSAMHRKGKRTSFDLLGGLERYLTAAKNQIYHIDDIQTLRALRNYIADTYGQANGLEGIDALSEEDAQERIEQVYGAHLSTFAKFLNEEANILAGKTALIDRGLEGIIGRRGMTFLDTVNKQVGSNMVGFNISSSLTNFLPVVQTFAKTNKFDFLKAFAQTTSNKFSSIFGKSDGFAENSPVIIRRKGADKFYRTPFQKAGDAGYVLMSAVDDISTELIARTKFNELTRKGMDEQAAHFETDKWVSRIMGDRSLGQQPQLYNSKTLGVLTKFQLEVRNQLDSQFYDTIQEAKVSNEDIENGLARNAKTAAKVTSTFVQLAVAQHLFGKAFEAVAGYNPAFDIISTLATMFGWDDDEESEDTVLDNIEQGFLELLEDLPYTSTFTGGRIPIASALPITELIKGVDSYGNEKSRLETLGEAAPYYVLPGGYGQIKKTAAGLGMFSDEHPISGSYTDSGKLRFPVEDTPLNRAQAAIFGQYASKNAREYFDNDYAPLSEKQIQEFIDVDIPIKDYRDYREGLKKQETLEDKFDYISGLDLPTSKKNILINNVVDRKEPVDLENYEDFGSLEEFDFATKDPEKYAFAKSVGGYSAYKTYSSELYDIKADKDANGKSINGSRKEKVINYINNLDADYYTKIILYKSEYPSDDSYNQDIVNYIVNRSDLSYADRVAILTELGFRVAADGQIYAD